jgi:hypothetical protein
MPPLQNCGVFVDLEADPCISRSHAPPAELCRMLSLAFGLPQSIWQSKLKMNQPGEWHTFALLSILTY